MHVRLCLRTSKCETSGSSLLEKEAKYSPSSGFVPKPMSRPLTMQVRGHTSTLRLLWEHTGAHLDSAARAVEELVGKASSPWERAELRRRGKAALASLATTAQGQAQLLAAHAAHAERADAAMTTLLAEEAEAGEQQARQQARQSASAKTGRPKRNKKRPPGAGSGAGSSAGEPPNLAMAAPTSQLLAAAGRGAAGGEHAEGAPAVLANAAAEADEIPATETRQGSGAHSGSTVPPLPDEFICPITTDIMTDPVVTVGNSRARNAHPPTHMHANRVIPGRSL